jgi:uncharacterized protein (UPF0335 family)
LEEVAAMLDEIKDEGFDTSIPIKLTPSMIRIAEHIAALQDKYRRLEEEQRKIEKRKADIARSR